MPLAMPAAVPNVAVHVLLSGHQVAVVHEVGHAVGEILRHLQRLFHLFSVVFVELVRSLAQCGRSLFKCLYTLL